jgi:hypothetical protein
MAIDRNALQALWKLEDIPACDEGMALAHAFLTSCVSALETCSSSNFNARFESYRRHTNECEKCREVHAKIPEITNTDTFERQRIQRRRSRVESWDASRPPTVVRPWT